MLITDRVNANCDKKKLQIGLTLSVNFDAICKFLQIGLTLSVNITDSVKITDSGCTSHIEKANNVLKISFHLTPALG